MTSGLFGWSGFVLACILACAMQGVRMHACLLHTGLGTDNGRPAIVESSSSRRCHVRGSDSTREVGNGRRDSDPPGDKGSKDEGWEVGDKVISCRVGDGDDSASADAWIGGKLSGIGVRTGAMKKNLKAAADQESKCAAKLAIEPLILMHAQHRSHSTHPSCPTTILNGFTARHCSRSGGLHVLAKGRALEGSGMDSNKDSKVQPHSCAEGMREGFTHYVTLQQNDRFSEKHEASEKHDTGRTEVLFEKKG
ncbi:hypothetical protein K488DRAFT_74818 [Vararia minispora EC-137]|uniref:Uncharacterized protein n=1 Tax=Vararia minispora EC-137 TaxID=1314806 RepID=A0ACB8Q5Z3_9AGAM|nr:hypothetical protein K488DRAFT_74818 [Vararia minispora EC-137]